MTFYKTPRGRSRKIRKYEHVDLSKEFEVRQKQREARKQERLEQLYQEHDMQALSLKDLVPADDLKKIDRSELTEEQLNALELREEAQKKLIAKLKQERQDLVSEFDEDTDLTKKVVISGIK